MAGLDGCDDRENEPGRCNDNGHGNADADKPKADRESHVDAVRDLEIENFLAGLINHGAFRTLEQPDYKRGNDMSEGKAENDPRESREMERNAPGAIIFRGVRSRGT